MATTTVKEVHIDLGPTDPKLASELEDKVTVTSPWRYYRHWTVLVLFGLTYCLYRVLDTSAFRLDLGSVLGNFNDLEVPHRSLVTDQVVNITAHAPHLVTRSLHISAQDKATALSAHNKFRALYGAKPLKWSNTLANSAQVWASRCVFEHSNGDLGPYGENIAAGAPTETMANGIRSWTNEAKQYDYKNPTYSHFTQVVWKSTKQLGCARVQCGSKIFSGFSSSDFIVCEYYPEGNVIGEFGQNVGHRIH